MTKDARSLFRQSEIAALDPACEEAFCRLIAQRTGILLQDHQLHNLRETVLKGSERFGYADSAQYLHELNISQGLTPPLEYLIAGVTVGESYFFRDNEQIELLRGKLLPELITAKRESGNLSFRIWSAGCSQGQEIYTIALLLLELIPDIDHWRIHLLGTDINNEVVAKAIRGRYSEWSFRATPPTIRERWFERVGNEYEIHSKIKHLVRFAYLNLTEDVYPSILSETNALDIILCRNVFIYLDRQVVQRSMANFADCLLERGMLLLGASDPVEFKHTRLELVLTGATSYFQKAGIFNTGEKDAQLAVPTPLAQSLRPVKDTFVPARHSIVETELPRPDEPAQHELTDEQLDEIIKQLKDSDWASALAQVDAIIRQGKENSDLWQMKAKALANLGKAELALHACERSLQLDPANKHTYLILGLILSELNHEKEAEAAFRKTLYLDRSFLEAHYELGMLRVRAKDMPGALKSLGNALKLAQQAGDPERELHNASGMTYRRFAQVLQNEIEMLSRV